MNGDDFWRWAERIALVAAILGVGVLAFFRCIWARLKRAAQVLRRATSSAPRDCLRIVPFPDRQYWWHQGTSDGKPAMQISGRWHVTNIAQVPVRILRARLTKPSIDTFLAVERPRGGLYGDYPFFPGRTANLSIHAFLEPMPCEAGEDFSTDVVLTDQFGNRCRIRKVVFHCDEETKAKAVENKAKESAPPKDARADGEVQGPLAR